MPSTDKSSKYVINRIADEIDKIADEIENLPSPSGDALTSEDIMRLQQIDFCSQKLRDIAAMVHEFESTKTLPEGEKVNKLKSFAKLEYVQKIVGADG